MIKYPHAQSPDPKFTSPRLSLPDQDNTNHSLSEYKGAWLLIYFYPKDDTPGCTTQACGVRDSYKEFQDAGIKVLGISKDSTKSHKKFQEKHQLPFTLLSDTTTQTAQKYGVWGPKKFMGKEYFGMHRVYFLIDPKGIIQKTYQKVDVLTHVKTNSSR